VDRIKRRTDKTEYTKKDEVVYTSLYEVIEKISEEVSKTNKGLVGDVILSKAPLTALENAIIKVITKNNYIVKDKTRDELIKAVKDHIFGYGLIQKYLDLEECSGVFVNGPDNVWAKIGKEMVKTDINFGSINNLNSYIRAITATLKGEINEDKALVKFTDEKNKLRIIIGISPISHISPTIVFRKHREEAFTLKDLVDMGMLTGEMAREIVIYANAGANVVVSGQGGAGKTTLMRAALEEIFPEKRILVMEEHPELFLKHPNAIQFLVKRSEKGEMYGIEKIADYGLLMTIDMYVFGEIRGQEAMTFFDGAFSGNVTWNTVHALESRKVIKKLMINMKKSGTNLPGEDLMEMLYESINLIIHMDSFVVREIVEIVSEEKGEAKYNTLWEYEISKRHNTFIEGVHKRKGKIKSYSMKEKLRQFGFLKVGDNTDSSLADSRVINFSYNIPYSS
jgi:pilus assembly protein CpaF